MNDLDSYNYNEINIYDFLRGYIDQDIIYIPNPGNAGDSLIAYGTIQVFNKIGLKWIFGNINALYANKTLFYGSGGNLVGIYNDCKKFINNNKWKNKIILLPHTIQAENKLIEGLGDNIIIICRERKSFRYVYDLIPNKNNVFLADDMAFNIMGIEKYKNIIGTGICNCFRTDGEKTNISIPKGNIDLSSHLRVQNNTSHVYTIEKVSLSVFEYLSKYDTINTNRLHIAIAGSLLNKKVNMYSNNYYKNREVYEYSLKNKYVNTKFIIN